MEKLSLILILLLITMMSFCQVSVYQEYVKIETKDGNEFVGVIVEEDDTKVVLKTEFFDEITIKKEIIAKRRLVESAKLVEGELWDDNPQSSRYLWTPNGYSLKEGEGYYQNIWVLYNQVSYGFTDHFSASVGVVPILLLGAEILGPVWLVPKFSIPLKKDIINMSAGAFIGNVAGESEAGFGIFFSTLTLGNRNTNLNLGLGWGYAGGDWARNPIVNISGMYRTSPRGYIITENYFASFDNDNLIIFSLGYRYMAKKVGIDFGLYLPISSIIEDNVAIPIVGITIPFSK